VEFVASLSQGRTAAAQCDLFTHKSVPVIFEPPCILDTRIPIVASVLRQQIDVIICVTLMITLGVI